jgi:diguanylate cyclase (GGDEF)-like protein
MPFPTPTPHAPSTRDDASRVMARIAAGGVLLVLLMGAVLGWSRWQDTRQRAQIVLRSYASVYARSYAQLASSRERHLRELATRLQGTPQRGHAWLARALRQWPQQRNLVLLDAHGRALQVTGPSLLYPAQQPQLPASLRQAWSACPGEQAACIAPPAPGPGGAMLGAALQRLTPPLGQAQWLAAVHLQRDAALLPELHAAYPDASLVLRRGDGSAQYAFPAAAATTRRGSAAAITVAVAVDGLRDTVTIAVPRAVLLRQWLRELLPYAALLLLLSAVGATLIGVATRRLRGLERQRRDAMQRLERASAFQSFRAKSNELIAGSSSEHDLLQAICDAAIGLSDVRLAWIGRPDAQGRCEVLAAAGAVDYLDGVDISTDAQLPSGRGPFSVAWRGGVAQFNPDFGVHAQAWETRATRHGLRASAALPIRRHNRQDAILSLYWGDPIEFDDSFRAMVGDAAADISRGLERLDLIGAQREALRAHERQGELMRTVFSQIDVLIASRNEQDLLDTACTRLLEGGLFVAAWIGQPDADGTVHALAAGGEALATLAAMQLNLREAPHGALARAWNSEAKAIESDSESPLIKPWSMFALPDMSPEAITLPIRRSEQLWGLLVLVATDGADLDEIVQNTLLRTAELIGQALTEIDLKQLLQTRESEQAHLARHDALTGLANRLALDQHLPRAIARARRSGHQLAIGVLDLDDFKPVNDTYGHAAGDRLLQELAQRLQGQLREVDLLARLGGDEFVLVLDDLDALHPRQQLGVILARLHRAVEQPFDLGGGLRAEVGMSMGVALYPGDGEDADLLLRQADVALYAAKSGKGRRERWWLLSGESLDEAEDDGVEPYGDAAAELLGRVQDDLVGLEDGFIEEFYRRLGDDAASTRIIDMLTVREFEHLREQQRRHLRRLLAPTLSRREHEHGAQRLGRIHATVGVDSSAVMAAMSQYSATLHRATQGLPLRLEARVKLQAVLQDRLATELQSAQRGGLEVEHERQAHLSSMEMQLDGWEQSGQLPRQVVAHLAMLPGICGVACGRPDADNHYVLEFAAGVAADYLQALREDGHDLDFQRIASDAPGPTQRAWSSGVIASEPNEGRAQPFGPIARRFGVRSTAALPLLDRSGHVHQVITLLGQYPGQFDAAGMRLWMESVQHQLNPAFQRVLAGQAQPIAATRRAHLHELLFGSGLQMYVQPLVNMQSGEIDKVEALARLQDGDRVLAPADFLEAFGSHELRILFRRGLEQSLHWLRKWDEQGLHIDTSVNLPPSVLLDPECANWIAQALHDYGVDADRVYVELLETHEDLLDGARRDAAIASLSRLGVRLIMDDLGSGYSSLKRMRSLPFHTVKIDQQIVLQAHDDPAKTIAFIGALVRMAQGLGMQVTMEGLETDDLIEMALSLGVEHGQGYALSAPMPAAALPDWLRAWRWQRDPAQPDTALGRQALLFARDVAPLDWQRVIASHQRFSEGIGRALRGHGTPLQWALVRRDDACLLGRWMKRQEATIWPEARPLFAKAQQLHAQFHHRAGELLRLAQHEGQLERALADLDNGVIDRASDRLVRALHQLSWIMSVDAALPETIETADETD